MNPCQHPPYTWGQPTYELGLTEPGHSMIPHGGYDLGLNEDLTSYPMFLEGLYARMYGPTSLNAQEN